MLLISQQEVHVSYKVIIIDSRSLFFENMS